MFTFLYGNLNAFMQMLQNTLSPTAKRVITSAERFAANL